MILAPWQAAAPTERFVVPRRSLVSCQRIAKSRCGVCVRGAGCIEAWPMNRKHAFPRFTAAILLALNCLAGVSFCADSVPVRYKEGLTHGFLVLSTLDGNAIAEGDSTEVAHGNQITNRVVYHFKDGSLQDETMIFSQRKTFALVSYHLIQKGPAFSHPVELSVEMSSGQVNVRYPDDKGEEKTEREHMKLPPNLANGMVLTLLKNFQPGETLPQLSMVVATPKPRIVKLSLSLQGKEPFTIVGSHRESLHYVIKVEIGGLAGLIAPLLGKQPPDSHVWIIGGDAPTFVKSETLSYLEGPMWRTELVSPVWPRSENADSKSSDSAKH